MSNSRPPYLHKATASGLAITAVLKWYHRCAIHSLRTLLPDIGTFFAVTWDPVYAGQPVTRTAWPRIPDGKRRVIREWQEVRRRVSDGSFKDAHRVHSGWH